MTDSQAINSSVLAEYLDVLKQMQASLQAHAVHSDYKSTQAYLARAMDTQLSSLIPNCDALRALVAEQEQSSAGEAISRAVDTLDEYANLQVTSSFLGAYKGEDLTIIRKANT